MGATIYAVSAYFPRHDPFIRAARLERRRRYLSAHRARRHRPDHRLRDGVRRPLAAMSRTAVPAARRARHVDRMDTPRSEEHTSELQSPCNLVCRLLLEKKKKTQYLRHSS